jgi:Glycosyltransferase family 87
MAAYAAFGAYAIAAAFLTGGRDRVWVIWAACGYAVALVMLWRWRSRRGRMTAVLVSVTLAVLAPLLWLSVGYPLEDGMMVIDRSASLLLHHGSPYLAADQVTSWLSYNPYLPVMTLFGLPSAIGIGGLAGNSGMWIAVGTVIPLAASFWIAVPRPGNHRRYNALLATAVAVASPVVGLNLAVITTDPPVLALILLALALAARPEPASRPEPVPRPGRTSWITGIIGAGVALGVACDLKSTAWLAVPVLAAMVAARDGARAAGRFVAAVAGTAVVLVAALAPTALTSLRGADALVQNSVLFPLGLTHDKTPAESLLPGHLLTALGPAGHVASVGLLFAAGLGIAISLVIRPPRDVPAAAWRLAVGLTLMFLLGPQIRFGYFIYPLGLVGWLALVRASPAPRR